MLRIHQYVAKGPKSAAAKEADKWAYLKRQIDTLQKENIALRAELALERRRPAKKGTAA